MSSATVNQFTELEVAMRKHAEFIFVNEQRTFSFLDFLHFKVDGREYTMTHGTFRNKISKFREKGIVEPAFNSGIAFYTLKGVQFGKNNTTSLMTPTRIQTLLQHMHRVPNIKKHPLYKSIKNHPFDKAAVHDLQLKFTSVGLWYILSSNNNDSTLNIALDPASKDIRLEKMAINNLEIMVTIHRTNTITVVIGCSNAPVAVDLNGVIRLSEALSTVEDELVRLVERHANKNGADIEIPNHMAWVVTRWDFGIDALVTYTGEKFFFSWKTS